MSDLETAAASLMRVGRASIRTRLGTWATLMFPRVKMSEAENGGYSFSTELEPTHILKQRRMWYEIERSDWTWPDAEVTALAQVLFESFGDACRFEADAFGLKDTDFELEPVQWIAEHICKPLARAYLVQLINVESDEDTLIMRLTGELERFLTAKGTPHTLRLGVSGLSFPAGPISIDVFEIRPLSLEEIATFIDLPQDTFEGELTLRPVGASLAWPDALVTLHFDGTHIRSESGQRATSLMQRFLTALSILGITVTAPHTQGLIRMNPAWLNGAIRGTAPFGIKVAEFNPPAQTSVTCSLAERAVTLAKRIPANAWARPKSAKDVVYHRYMQGLARQQDIDRIFDFVIAMESCLVNDNAELSHKFSLFGAQFMGRDGTDRLELRDQLRTLYSIRSRLAHGTRFPTYDEIRHGALTAQLLCQRMLLKCLEDGWPIDGDLDRQLLSRDDD